MGARIGLSSRAAAHFGRVAGRAGPGGRGDGFPAAIAKALDWYDAGLEFADALHLAGASRSQAFVTFDERLVRRAKRAGLTSVVTVPR